MTAAFASSTGRAQMNCCAKMQKLGRDANAGLVRRFGYTYDFPNFSLSEIATMFTMQLERESWTAGKKLTQKAVESVLQAKTSEAWRAKINGGLVDKLYEGVVDAQSARLNPSSMTREQASTIELFDVQAAAGRLQGVLMDWASPSERVCMWHVGERVWMHTS